MKLIPCALMAIVIASNAGTVRADDWGTTEQIAFNGIAVNITSLKRYGNDAIFWAVVVPKLALIRRSKSVAYEIDRMQIDCDADTIDIRSVTAYGSRGDVIESGEAPAGAEPIRPESMGADLADIACNSVHVDVIASNIDSTIRFLRNLIPTKASGKPDN